MSTRNLARLAAAALALLTLSACSSGDPLDNDSASEAPADTVVVGSANFSENVILGEIYAQALNAAGINTKKQFNIGSRETYIPAMQNGEVDLIPEYTGNLLLYFDKDATAAAPEEVESALIEQLPDGLEILNPSAAEDKDSLVVTQETAEKHSLTTIADLAPVAGELTMGASAEFKTRAYGLPGLKEVYGVEFGDFKTLDSGGPLSSSALKDGDVDVTDLFSTNPLILQENWVVLEDPKHLIIAQNVVPLIRTEKATDEVTQVLNDVSAALDTQQLTELVKQVDIDKKNPDDVAGAWLADKGLN